MQTGVIAMPRFISEEDLSGPIQDSADVDVLSLLHLPNANLSERQSMRGKKGDSKGVASTTIDITCLTFEAVLPLLPLGSCCCPNAS